MATYNYYQICALMNKGIKTDKISVLFRGDWITWDEALKILKGLDFDAVKYRVEK